MRRTILILVLSLFIPAVCYASLSGVIGEVYGTNGQGRAVVWIVAIDIGRWLIKTACSVIGNGGSSKWIDYIARSVQATIVIATVYSMLKTAFDLMGI